MYVRCKKNNIRANAGFTLIELMVSVSIFALVMVMAMGTMMTILDSNRKARTLTEVMNNVNFALENITRAVKTGVEPNDDNGVLSVTAIILEQDVAGDRFRREKIEYQLQQDGDRGYITRKDGNGTPIPITSDMVDVNRFAFGVAGTTDFNQPRTQILIEGDVRINDKISSSFSVQTTISQRKLNLENSEDL